jgi:hypothetical protein
MRELGRAARTSGRVYFTGGATAVWHGWRESTVDIDLKLSGDDALFHVIARLKDSLQVNVEQACPSDFIPEVPGWEDRSIFVGREGKLDFYHYDPYSQALSKLQRGHSQDLADVASMAHTGLIERGELLRWFERIENNLPRYSRIDPAAFRRRVEAFVAPTDPEI